MAIFSGLLIPDDQTQEPWAIKLNYSMKHTVKERFLKYVTIDTQADPESDSSPSTSKQKNLSKLLVEELKEMGIAATTDKHGYVYATLPSNVDHETDSIFFCSHVDTAPDCSGKDVKPIVHHNYSGQDIMLPDDPTQIISMKDYSYLREKIGEESHHPRSSGSDSCFSPSPCQPGRRIARSG